MWLENIAKYTVFPDVYIPIYIPNVNLYTNKWVVLLKLQSAQFVLPKTISFEKLSVSLHLTHFIVSVVVMLLIIICVVQSCLEIP